jgi:hypothetical protein
MGNIVDGIQRPLRVSAITLAITVHPMLLSLFKSTQSQYIYPVVSTPMR